MFEPGPLELKGAQGANPLKAPRYSGKQGNLTTHHAHFKGTRVIYRGFRPSVWSTWLDIGQRLSLHVYRMDQDEVEVHKHAKTNAFSSSLSSFFLLTCVRESYNVRYKWLKSWNGLYFMSMYTLSLHKNIIYKNIEAEICEPFRTFGDIWKEYSFMRWKYQWKLHNTITGICF